MTDQNSLDLDRMLARWNGEALWALAWHRHLVGDDAARIAALLNEKFGKGQQPVTPENVEGWIERFRTLRSLPAQSEERELERLMAGVSTLGGGLALAMLRFRGPDAGPDPGEQRMGVVCALQAVCDFVEGFVDTPDETLTAPLRAMMQALFEFGEAPTHPMLDLPRARWAANRPPSSAARNALVAHAVTALEAALGEGNDLKKAGRMVAAALHKRGYRRTKEGRPIKGGTVVTWRAEAMRPIPEPSYEFAASCLAEQGPRIKAEAHSMPKGSWEDELSFLDAFGPDLGLEKNSPG